VPSLCLDCISCMRWALLDSLAWTPLAGPSVMVAVTPQPPLPRSCLAIISLGGTTEESCPFSVASHGMVSLAENIRKAVLKTLR